MASVVCLDSCLTVVARIEWESISAVIPAGLLARFPGKGGQHPVFALTGSASSAATATRPARKATTAHPPPVPRR